MGKLFKKKKSQEQPAPTVSGPKDITDVIAGPLFLKTAQQFVERPQGFGPEFVERTSRPDIQQLDARFAEEVKPDIEAEMSSRGLGRSSLATQQLIRASQQKERDIASILGGAYGQQAGAKQEEKFQGFQGLGQGTQLGLGAGQASAALQAQQIAQQQALAQRRREDEAQKRMSLFGGLLQGGGIAASLASPFLYAKAFNPASFSVRP